MLEEMEEGGMEFNLFTCTSLLVAYSKARDVEKAEKMWRSMLERGFRPDLKCYNALLSLYSSLGELNGAEKVVEEMERSGVERDRVSWLSLLGVCGRRGRLEEGVRMHEKVVSRGLWPGREKECTYLTTALIGMYASCGGLEEAEKVFKVHFEAKGEVEVSVYSSMIGAYAQYGLGEKALGVFGELCAKGLRPDVFTFSSLLTALSVALLPDKVLEIVGGMEKNFGMTPRVSHHSCVVDALANAGRLEEAEDYMRKTELIRSDVPTLVCLLMGCKNYGEYERAARILRGVREEVRNFLKEKKGGAWTWVGSNLHWFGEENPHPEMENVSNKALEIFNTLSNAGYTPQASPQSPKEEMLEKELCGHLEMQAIALALMKMEEMGEVKEQVVVFKNMSVCVDCHEASKWISKVFGKTIKLKESRRWHVFKDGVCSCSDCW
uniref:DYW domain-containing protein n=1 Tax=Arcella intermedia TaxID=1963864 RepID=A0A6B2L3L9_9EUKA